MVKVLNLPNLLKEEQNERQKLPSILCKSVEDSIKN